MLTSCPWKGRCAWVALLAALVAGCAAPAPDPGGGRAEARRILEEAQVTAVGIEDAEFKAAALAVIAGWQATAGDVPGALESAAALVGAAVALLEPGPRPGPRDGDEMFPPVFR